MNVTIWALEGRVEMLAAIFGNGEAKDKPRGGGVSNERWRAFAKAHNQRYAQLRLPKRRRRRGGE